MVQESTRERLLVLRFAYAEQDRVPPLRSNSLKALAKAMVHEPMTLGDVHNHYRRLVRGTPSEAWQMAPAIFREFLSTTVLFLKAETERGKMREYDPNKRKESLKGKLLDERALAIAEILMDEDVNKNKLTRLAARVTASRDEYEALAHLARFYPLSGVPEKAVNELVSHLESVDFDDFKDLVSLGLIFYRAEAKGWPAPEEGESESREEEA